MPGGAIKGLRPTITGRPSIHHKHRGLYGAGVEPVHGFLAGLTLETTAGPRSLDGAAAASPLFFRLPPAGGVAGCGAREMALLTGPISELVTELRGDDGRSMADESEPSAVPPALPVTPSALPDP